MDRSPKTDGWISRCGQFRTNNWKSGTQTKKTNLWAPYDIFACVSIQLSNRICSLLTKMGKGEHHIFELNIQYVSWTRWQMIHFFDANNRRNFQAYLPVAPNEVILVEAMSFVICEPKAPLAKCKSRQRFSPTWTLAIIYSAMNLHPYKLLYMPCSCFLTILPRNPIL